MLIGETAAVEVKFSPKLFAIFRERLCLCKDIADEARFSLSLSTKTSERFRFEQPSHNCPSMITSNLSAISSNFS